MKRLLAMIVLASLLLTGCAGKQEPSSTTCPPEAEGMFTMTFITIGKGDAFLMESPEGRFYLMDTGKAQDYQQIVRMLRLKGVEKLDGIFLSHGHKDHAGCLEPLLEDLPVERVYISKADHVSYTEIDPRKILPRFENTELVELSGGEVLDLGGAKASVWIPPVVDVENANNNSLILRVVHGANSFLLMGDCELEEEAVFMNADFPLESTLLKLGHHGETDASSPAFLDAVKPRIALIAGNADENPDSENPFVASLLEQRKIDAYYSKGVSLDFCSDGTNLIVREAKEKEFPCELNLKFIEVNRKEQYVIIKNIGGSAADLTGCTLISERGDEIYHFPAGTILNAGEPLVISCQNSKLAGDLIWKQDSVWKKKGDNALLYDRNMNLLDSDLADE